MSSASLPARFWLLTAAALAAASITLALGFWQLSRAAEKEALRAAMEGRQALPVLDGAALAGMGPGADILYRMVSLRGTWLAQHTVLLDNRQMNGKPGFFVLTPLRLENSTEAVLVQRGWMQRSFIDRTQVAAVPTPEGLVDVAGRIVPPPSKLYDFGDPDSGVIRQNLDLPGFSRETGVALAPVSVLQLAPAADGLVRDWPRANSGVEKHYGYAFQWFALCGLIVFLYGWFQIVRRFLRPR